MSVRQQLAAHVRARAVGADEYVSLCSRAILKALNYPAVRRCLEGSEGFAKDDDASPSGVSPRYSHQVLSEPYFVYLAERGEWQLANDVNVLRRMNRPFHCFDMSDDRFL